jgi:hypothetical protein
MQAFLASHWTLFHLASFLILCAEVKVFWALQIWHSLICQGIHDKVTINMISRNDKKKTIYKIFSLYSWFFNTVLKQSTKNSENNF